MKSSELNQNERTRCEVWTRVMGYHRPVSAFNAGKQAEHRDRRLFTEAAQQGLEMVRINAVADQRLSELEV